MVPIRVYDLRMNVLTISKGLLRINRGLTWLRRCQDRKTPPSNPILVRRKILVKNIAIHQIRRLRWVMNIIILLRLIMDVGLQKVLILIRLMNLIALPIWYGSLVAFGRLLGPFFIEQNIVILLGLLLILLLVKVVVQELLVDHRGAEVEVDARGVGVF